MKYSYAIPGNLVISRLNDFRIIYDTGNRIKFNRKVTKNSRSVRDTFTITSFVRQIDISPRITEYYTPNNRYYGVS